MRRGWGAVPAATITVAVVLALAGCGGGESKPAPTPTGPSVTPIPQGYPSDAPTGLPYTQPGTTLNLGQAATVAWQPAGAAATSSASSSSSSSSSASVSPSPSSATTASATGTPAVSPSGTPTPKPTPIARPAGALAITVTSIKATTYAKSFRDWKVSDALATSVPYFVTAQISNVGATALGGLSVPLYGATAADTLVEPSTFASEFKPCGPSAFPKRFAKPAKVKVCLVYLVPDGGSLTGVTFRPTAEFDPITWGVATPSSTVAATGSSGATPTPPGTIGATPTPSATMSK